MNGRKRSKDIATHPAGELVGMAQQVGQFSNIIPDQCEMKSSKQKQGSNDDFSQIGPVPVATSQTNTSLTTANTLEMPTMIRSVSNKELRELFPVATGPMTCYQLLVLFLVIGSFSAAAVICLSGLTPNGYKAFDVLIGLEPVWHIVLGMGMSGALFLHAFDWYHWRMQFKAPPGIVVFYLVQAGVACHAKQYPSAPMIVCFLQFPIVLALLRYHSASRLGISVHSFFNAAAAAFLSAAVIVIVTWTVWIFKNDMLWGHDTKVKLRGHLQEAGVFARYDISDWSECLDERALKTGADKKVLSHCARIELAAYLIYVCPFAAFMILFVLGMFCLLRLRIIERGTSVPERTLRLILFFLLLLVTAFWAACSTAGASMELSRVMLASIGLACVCFTVWLLFVVNLEDVMEKATDTVIFKTFEPAVRSDYFTACIFCFTSAFLLMFFMLEFFVRQLERIRGVKGSGSGYFTTRSAEVFYVIRDKHWAVSLEKAFNLSMLYLVLFLCSRFTPVFLSWLDEDIKKREFGVVCLLFYVAGLVMFLLPPVPGVPVYIAAGAIIVSRAKQEEWLDFYSGLAFAACLGLVLKLNAVAMQQKLIGEALGRYVYIQQLVGVHRTSIRAIEKILKRPGLTFEKVAILCGGPDWPTSVLTGILRLSLPQMLLGTLPCFFLIIPCVLAGSSLHEENLKTLSPMLIVLVGVSQGGMMLAALLFIAKESERSYAELSKPLPEHEILVKRTEEVARLNAAYKRATVWAKLNCVQKVLLSVAVTLEVGSCWTCFFVGGLCFRKFSIGGDIAASYEDGGLHGKWYKMVKPPGEMVLLAIAAGVVLFFLYKCTTRQKSNAVHAHADLTPTDLTNPSS